MWFHKKASMLPGRRPSRLPQIPRVPRFECESCLKLKSKSFKIELDCCPRVVCRKCLILGNLCPFCSDEICQICLVIHATGSSCEDYWRAQDANEGRLYPVLPGTSGLPESPNTYDLIRELENEPCIPNFEPFECSICYSDIDVGVGVMLKSCLHNFCRDCLCNQIKAAEQPEVNCPFAGCESKLQDPEVRNIATPEVYEEHCKRSLTLAETGSGENGEKSFHCLKADCRGFCFLGPEEEPEVFVCEVCHSENCIRCKLIHVGLSCQEHREREAQDQERQARNQEDSESASYLEDCLARGEAMRCPGCSAIVKEKVDGCDGMQCIVCKIELCWATKKRRWGPGGKGDTSDGCRCHVDGVLCTPTCNNCH